MNRYAVYFYIVVDVEKEDDAEPEARRVLAHTNTTDRGVDGFDCVELLEEGVEGDR